MEIEAIEKMRQELKDKRKHNEEFMKKALAAGGYTPYRSAMDNLTQAVEFHFETDKRIKAPQPQTSTDNKEKNFFETLRQHPVSPVSVVELYFFQIDSYLFYCLRASGLIFIMLIVKCASVKRVEFVGPLS